MSEHTTGPWIVETANGFVNTEYFVRRDGESYAIASDIRDPDTHRPSLQTAKMIAAAPELLECLEDLIDNMIQPPDSNCSCHISPPCHDCVEYAGLRDLVETAKLAIAKATGKEDA